MAARHLFVLKSAPSVRDRLMERMLAKGVQTLIHYPHPLYRQPAFAAFGGESPVCEDLCASVLSLPFHQNLGRGEIDYVVKSLSESLAE